MKTFPLNAWYAAAYDVEVKHALLARTVCNQKIVMFRRQDGSLAALEDACWHRLLPLSMGRLDGDELVCGYHGLVFNGDGRCTHMPSQETINPSACVRAFPVVQKHRFVWIWPGDPALADEAKIPDLHWNDDPAWAGDGKLITVKCDYRLVLDNLMDLTHEAFVHGASKRMICHYFWAFARNYSLGEQRLTHELREGVASIFREDELVLEAQQKAIDEHPGYTFYNLNIDAGSMWARKLIDKQIAAEAPPPETTRVIPLRAA